MKGAPASFSPHAARLALAVAFVLTPPLLAGALIRQASRHSGCEPGSPIRPAATDEWHGLAETQPSICAPVSVGGEPVLETDHSALTAVGREAKWVPYWLGCVDPTHGSTSQSYVVDAFHPAAPVEDGPFSERRKWILGDSDSTLKLHPTSGTESSQGRDQ